MHTFRLTKGGKKWQTNFRWCLYFFNSFCIKSKSLCKSRTWDCAFRARSSASFPNSIKASLSLSYSTHSFSNWQRWATKPLHSPANLWFSSTNFFRARAFIIASYCSKNPRTPIVKFSKRKIMTRERFKRKSRENRETLKQAMRWSLRFNWGSRESRPSRRRHSESWEARSLASRVSDGVGMPKELSMVCLMQLSTAGWMVFLMQLSMAGGWSIGAIDRTKPKQEFRKSVWIEKIREKEPKFCPLQGQRVNGKVWPWFCWFWLENHIKTELNLCVSCSIWMAIWMG